MKLLYFDCPAGLSCGMMAGALLDMGADINYLAGELNKINFGVQYEINLSKVQRQGISASLFETDTEGISNEKISASQILSVISESGLKTGVKNLSISAFLRLLAAYAAVSGREEEEIYIPLNEAVKTVAHICSVMILTDSLPHDSVIFSPVAEGSGFVRRKDNIYSIPDPVVSEILMRGQIKINFTEIPKALITDSGAAVCAELSEGFMPLSPVIIKAVGYGAAGFNLDERAAVLRVISGETQSELTKNTGTAFDMETSGLFYDSFGYNMNKNFNKKV